MAPGHPGPMMPADPPEEREAEPPPYRLDDQIGFVLRQVVQRHAAIFAAGMDQALTAPQWAALAKLAECGPLSQNQLGRLIVTDAATIKGVVDRLSARNLTRTSPDPGDRRRYVVELTAAGRALVARSVPRAFAITAETLAPLDEGECARLMELLRKLC